MLRLRNATITEIMQKQKNIQNHKTNVEEKCCKYQKSQPNNNCNREMHITVKNQNWDA